MTESHDPPEKTPGPLPLTRTASEREQRAKIEKQLDEALADSFPASDPVSIVTSQQEDWDQPESK